MIALLERHVARNIRVATFKVKVTVWPWSKTCPDHNFIIWSRILKLFHRNDHQFETTCSMQHLCRYLEGQGHSMTSQQKCVRPFILLFEVGFYNYLITILRWCVTTLPIVLALYVVYCIIN